MNLGVMTSPPTQAAATVRVFSVRLSSTRRGARLARRFAAQQLDAWGIPYGSETSDTVSLIVCELAANAAFHGRVQGRDFRLALAVTDDDRLRIEVTDTRGELLPSIARTPPAEDAESGRGLLLVESLADRWGVVPGPLPLKTVWAEVALPEAFAGVAKFLASVTGPTQ